VEATGAIYACRAPTDEKLPGDEQCQLKLAVVRFLLIQIMVPACSSLYLRIFKPRTLRLGSPACSAYLLFVRGADEFATDVVTYHYDIARTGQNLQELF